MEPIFLVIYYYVMKVFDCGQGENSILLLIPLVDRSSGVRCKHRNNSHSNTIVNYKILFCLEQELMAVEIVIMQVPTSKVLLASKTKGWHVVLNMESTLRLVFCRSQDCDLLQESACPDDCAQYLQLTSFT